MKERFIILSELPTTETTRIFLGGAKRAKSVRRTPPALQVRVDEIDPAAVPRLGRDQKVKAIAPAMPMRLIRPPTGTKKKKGAKSAAEGWGIRAVGADTSSFSGDGIVVAVLDTGIDPKHPAFKGVKIVPRNFTGDAAGDDVDGHGTHCAGTLFGRDVAGTRIGVARGVKKALIGKVIGKDGADTLAVAEAIQWALNENANIISMSLGFDFPDYQRELEEGGLPADIATSRALDGYRRNVALFEQLAGMVERRADLTGVPAIVVAAAGNESRVDEDPRFRIAVSPPAIANGFISVAALGEAAGKYFVAPFSNTGALVAGPGVDITSAKRGGGLAVDSGTSMAAPHVAGVAALWAEMLSATGRQNPRVLTARLVGSASTDNLQAGVVPEDVGSGMVTAPE